MTGTTDEGALAAAPWSPIPTQQESELMVTHGGRCPQCAQRTVPGIGARAGYWLCVPCQAMFDNYGHMQGTERPQQVLVGIAPPRTLTRSWRA